MTDDLTCHNLNDLPPQPHQCRADYVWDASIRVCVERGSTLGGYQPKIDANPKTLYRRDDLTTNTLHPNHFKPDIDLHIYLHSDPLHLGYAHTHATEGSFTATHQIPNAAPSGDHTVVATAAEFEYDTLLHAQATAKVKIQVLERTAQSGTCTINGALAPEYTNPEDCEAAGGTWAPEPGFCYVGDTYSPQYTTREDCEAAGGSWLSGSEHDLRQAGISPTGIYVTGLLIFIAIALLLALIARKRRRVREETV